MHFFFNGKSANTFMNPKEAKQKAALSLPCSCRDDTILRLNSSWLPCPQNNQLLNATGQQGNSLAASPASCFWSVYNSFLYLSV